jgi:C4-dicarboxylate-specific signal transduction histidine kinase
MGLASADVEALRKKLRAQFGKLDALVSEAVEPVRELALEPRVSEVDLAPLLARVVESLREEADIAGASVRVDAPAGLRVRADATLLARVLGDLTARALEAPARADAKDAPVLLVARRDGDTAVVAVQDRRAPLGEDARRAPFHIVGGGTRLAIARYLAQIAGGQLRLEPADGDATRFAVHLPAIG